MRQLILHIVLIILFIPTTIQAQQVIPQDKLIHMSGSYIVTHMTYSYLQSNLKLTRKQAIHRAMLVGLIVGIGKEVYDIQCGSPELGDIAADLIGIATFRVVLEF